MLLEPEGKRCPEKMKNLLKQDTEGKISNNYCWKNLKIAM